MSVATGTAMITRRATGWVMVGGPMSQQGAFDRADATEKSGNSVG